MKKFLSIFTVCAIALMGFSTVSCSKDNEPSNSSYNSGDKGSSQAMIDRLVSNDIPNEGWSGSLTDGVARYGISDDYDEGEYLSFVMDNGVCQGASLNLVFESSSIAKRIAKILNSGELGDFDDDDDDEWLSPAKVKEEGKGVIGVPKFSGKALRRMTSLVKATRANGLVIPVSCKGNVVYVMIPNFVGTHSQDILNVVGYWTGNVYTLPDHIVFGKYSNGVYTCDDLYGVGLNYRIETTFDSQDYCTGYKTIVTCPTEDWAYLMYATLDEQADEMYEEYGVRPTLSLNNKKVTMDAVIIGDVSRDEVFSMICFMDWANNRPFLLNMF
ncbi:MAG: hypothetical protein K2M37_03475 [Muribaculaceae bacterium]|nr:hypothetical protein [Muribaculaceae bacterium]